MKIYQKISLYINENGIKQRFISDKTGIPENILSMILNGKRKMDADEFVEIILALGVDANFFINVSNKEN
jgi:plasmid maintenance system antidote protein VapI